MWWTSWFWYAGERNCNSGISPNDIKCLKIPPKSETFVFLISCSNDLIIMYLGNPILIDVYMAKGYYTVYAFSTAWSVSIVFLHSQKEIYSRSEGMVAHLPRWAWERFKTYIGRSSWFLTDIYMSQQMCTSNKFINIWSLCVI